jgi:uncharacterized protein
VFYECFRSGLLIIFAVFACGCADHPEPTIAKHIRLGAGAREGSFYTLGYAMAKAYEAAIPNLSTEVQITPGSVDTLTALEAGSLDVGLSVANVLYAAYDGHLRSDSKPFRRLRAIAILELTPVHLVVAPHSKIRSVSDLRGKRLNIIPNVPNSGTFMAAAVILKVYGLTMENVHLDLQSYDNSVSHLLDGTLDALFVTGAYPIERVSRATRGNSRLVPLTKESIEKIIEVFPFFRPVIIPRGTYPETPIAVRTIGVETVLACRSDLDENVVYDLTRGLFQIQREITAQTGLVQWVDMKLAAATPIPLHRGAARYYRQVELFR